MFARVQAGGGRLAVGRLSVVGLLAVLAAATGCTDTELYSPTRAKAQANRLAVEGRVCTEDPVRSRFPVRVILLVDRAQGPLFSDYDPAGNRIDDLQKFAKNTLKIPKTAMSVIGYAGRPTQLAPKTGEFTTNISAVSGALNQLAIPRSCAGPDQCRDYREALQSARATIEGDLADLPAGTRALTQYFVVTVNAGPQQPLIDPLECCAPDDAQCRANVQNAGDPKRRRLARDCESERQPELVSEMREMVAESGASGFQFHAIHLAAYSGTGGGGAQIDDRVQDAMEAMAFAGNGTYQRFNAVGGLRPKAFDILGFRTVLRSKLLMAANHNSVPGPNGPLVDSDADGLPDRRETAGNAGTSPKRADTDGDGITDRVELLAGLDPTSPNEPPACEPIDSAADDDLDRLTNCDEKLLGTEPTLVDTDGDGLADPFEVFAGTDYLNRDGDVDTDGDGVDNGEEIRRRLDPRSNDTQEHLSNGYRYEVENQGVVTELFASKPEQIGGVQIVDVSEGSTPGLGTLKFVSGSKQKLRWRDLQDDDFGGAVAVGEGGRFKLHSNSSAPVQGEDGKWIRVDVRPAALPPETTTETIRVTSRRRQCLTYTVRNIRLVETRPTATTERGSNDIVLYFAEAPAGELREPGPFRRAQIPVRFNPPDRREPSGAVLKVDNREFVRPEITLPRNE